MERISIIVPVYKVEAYLDRCVRSIAAQTYTNLEIILVDDGSPDRCGAMCDDWARKDPRIKVIHKENGGLSDARNAGMAIASGSYIAFTDSDDWVHPSYIACLYEAVITHGAQLAACDVQLVYEDAVEYPPIAAVSECCTPEQAIRSITENSRFRAVAWNKLYHRSLLEGEQFPVGRYHEDEFFTYRILDKAEKLAYVDAMLYYYYQRPGSIMNSACAKHMDALDAFLERLEFFRVKYPAFYENDKFIFCLSCIHLYQLTLETPTGEWLQLRRRILEYRRRIRFSFSEIRKMPPKNAVYVLGSKYAMHLLCMLQKAARRIS